jgi:UDP-glucose 4-epimerase
MSGPVVVTGASGFVGQALLNWLRHEGVPVTGVTRRRWPGLATVADYVDTPVTEGAVLVHLAQGGDPSAQFDESAIALCRAISARRWRHIVYASSAIVYGDEKEYPRRPEESVSAVSGYARVKIACEEIFGEAGGTSLRLANLYGPGMEKNTVIADILRQIPGQGPLIVRDPAPVRDFLWIEDAARCLAAACVVMPGGIFNAGNGRGVAVGDIARIALALAGEDTRLVIAENATGRASNLVLDIDKTRSGLNWSPEIDLHAGLALLLSSARR